MSMLTRPRPPEPDAPPDTEALEALIEEARQRARRRRRGYAAGTLGAVAAGLIGFYGFDGDDANRPQPRAGQPTAGTALAAQGEWRAAPGFEGGRVTALAIDPQHPTTVFAATLRGGVFKSSDGGRSWQALDDIGPSANRVDALTIAPGDRQAVYVGSGRGIHKSRDGGATWQTVYSGAFRQAPAAEREHRRLEGFVSAFTVDPTDPEVVYANTGEGVVKTTDGGASWQSIDLTSAGPIVVDPRDPDTLYAGAVGGRWNRGSIHRRTGLWKSGDGGESWQRIGLRGADVRALALDPRPPATLYAATDDEGVVRSMDGGASWRSTGLEARDVQGLILHPGQPRSVLALSGHRIFLSRDGGDAWRAVGPGWSSDTWISPNAVAFLPRARATIYVGASGEADAGVLKSRDGGDSWRAMNAGLIDARASAIAVDPRTPGTAYAAIAGRGVFKRSDGRWQAAIAGWSSEVHTVAVAPQDPGAVYAGTNVGAFKSTNGGASWSSSLMAPLHADVSAFAFDPHDPTTVYAIAADGKEGHPRGSTRFFKSRLYKSTDGGATWPTYADMHDLAAALPDETLTRTIQESPLAIDPLRPDTLYVGGLGVRKSVDGGRTWRRAGLSGTAVLALEVDPGSPTTVYAGTDAGLFTSTDAGASWQASDGPLDGLRVRAVAIDPRGPRTVYAGTDKGVFWTAGDGDHGWRRFKRLPRRAFNALAVDTNAGIVYAGSYGGGLFELERKP